jgi:hypothetical protein
VLRRYTRSRVRERRPLCGRRAFGDGQIRIVKVDSFTPQPFTVVGWAFGDVRDLARRGVQFLRFEGMEQDEDGVWDPTGGGGVAWFKDPDGNTLSVSARLSE